MIRPLLQLLRHTPERRRLGLFAACGALAAVAGFVTVAPRAAERIITEGGYYFILGVVALFAYYARRVATARRDVWRGWLRVPGWPGAVILLATAFALWCDPFKHKILFDEYVLQGTALQMHATKEFGTIIRAYDIDGSWTPIDTFFDKRPYFFTFLVSLVHDLTGYRIANMFFVNAALTPALFALVYWLARELTGRRGPAFFSVALLATMPLVGQQSSGAGMELHNLVMLALEFALGVLYLRAPDEDRLSLFVLGAVLLSQCRYESVLYVVPAAFVVVAGWLRAGRVLLTWPAIFAPLLLVPYVWQKRVTDATPLLWQLHEGETSRFSAKYLAHNLAGAGNFFFNLGPALANSACLSVLGLAGLAWALARAWRWARDPAQRGPAPVTVVFAAFGAGVGANFALLMFYYWSSLDDVIASRFALPACLLLAWFAALLVHWLGEWGGPVFARRFEPRGVLRAAWCGLGVWLLGFGLPAMARRLYTDQNLVMQEVEWEHEELGRLPGPLLFISNKSTIPFVMWHVPTIINGVGRQRAAQIKFHLREGTFREVIVAQALRPTTPQGDMGVDPDDVMPPSYHLETIAVKRFGGRWARLSRLVSIDDPAGPAKSTAAASPAPGAPLAALSP